MPRTVFVCPTCGKQQRLLSENVEAWCSHKGRRETARQARMRPKKEDT